MLAALFGICARGQSLEPAGRVIDILADHDSRYKMPGQKQPIITVRAGEPITLRVTAKKAKNVNRDGAIHGFTLLRAKDRSPVDGWDFMLKPGVQEFSLVAPGEPGEYVEKFLDAWFQHEVPPVNGAPIFRTKQGKAVNGAIAIHVFRLLSCDSQGNRLPGPDRDDRLFLSGHFVSAVVVRQDVNDAPRRFETLPPGANAEKRGQHRGTPAIAQCLRKFAVRPHCVM